MVEMRLIAVRVEVPSNTPVLLLQEHGAGQRTLPIYIGPAEANAIDSALRGVVPARPLTHDLMRDLLDTLGAKVERVVITELREKTFFAEIHLARGQQHYVVSARPSDAIALATRTETQIFADDKLIAEEGVVLTTEEQPVPEQDAANLMSQFKEFIEGVRPEDFDTGG